MSGATSATRERFLRLAQELRDCEWCGTRLVQRDGESNWAFVSRRFCNRGCVARHGNVLRTRTPDERFWASVQGGDVESCWLWQQKCMATGYGTFWVEGRRSMLAHRYAYEALRAEIPDGLSLDHLCRNPSCVNPWHLEPVTHRVNVRRGESPPAKNARKTHCVRGHSLDPSNVYLRKGQRICKTCVAERNRQQFQARKARRAA